MVEKLEQVLFNVWKGMEMPQIKGEVDLVQAGRWLLLWIPILFICGFYFYWQWHSKNIRLYRYRSVLKWYIHQYSRSFLIGIIYFGMLGMICGVIGDRSIVVLVKMFFLSVLHSCFLNEIILIAHGMGMEFVEAVFTVIFAEGFGVILGDSLGINVVFWPFYWGMAERIVNPETAGVIIGVQIAVCVFGGIWLTKGGKYGNGRICS